MLRAVWFKIALIAVACIASVALDCVNWRNVFAPDGQIDFADPDCYARMTRVREVYEHPGAIVRVHYFENYPFGVRSHTTAPLDYLIAALGWMLHPVCGTRAVDLAGAWISPLLGVIAIAGLGWFGGNWAALALLAISPIMGQCFALGRPDHQSLLVALMAAALAAEFSLWRAPSRAAGWVSGAAWGLGLWVSLYEPGVLLLAVLAIELVWHRQALRRPEKLVGVGIVLVALAIEGWRFQAPGGEYFERWASGGQISELQSLPPWSPVIYAWVGWAILAAPFLLWEKRGALVLLAFLFAMTCLQMRWGYFLALVYALTLPRQLEALPFRWRWALLLGAWPMLAAPRAMTNSAELREDNVELREAANFIRREGGAPGSILAPWWQSPALAYWSGAPAVAGSSHESLPGIVDVARYYVSDDGSAILTARGVRWVVAYEPERVLYTAAALLGETKVSTNARGGVLYQRPDLAGGRLRLAFANQFFRVYEVRPSL